MKRFLSWLVLLFEIPAVAAAFTAVYAGLNLLSEKIQGIKSFIGRWLADDTVFELGLAEVLMTILLYILIRIFIRLSEKICHSRACNRYLVLAVLSALAGLFFVYCRIRGGLPFTLPFTLKVQVLSGAALALFVNAWWIFRDVRRLKNEVPEVPEAICVFCYRKPDQSSLIPFAYVSGGPGLVHDGIEPALPERSGKGFDANLFLKMKEAVLEREFRGSVFLQYQIFAAAGFTSGGKAVCPDLVIIDTKEDRCTYADLAHPRDGSKPQILSFDLESILTKRRVVIDPDAPEAEPASIPGRAPRSRKELVEAVCSYPGTAVFASCRRLGIDLQNNVFNVKKLEPEQLAKLLLDLRTHT